MLPQKKRPYVWCVLTPLVTYTCTTPRREKERRFGQEDASINQRDWKMLVKVGIMEAIWKAYLKV
jgi:hypothetical protein